MSIRTSWFTLTISITRVSKKKAQELLTDGIERENLVLSVQVIGEFFTVVTRHIPHPLKSDEAREIIATISILLGFFNLFPIPGLDGGHALITLVEMIRRKSFSMKVIQGIQMVGVFLILSLAVLITVKDVFFFDFWNLLK